MDTLYFVGVSSFAIVGLAALWWRRRHDQSNGMAGHATSQTIDLIETEGELATSVVLGPSADTPVLVVSISNDEQGFALARPLSNGRADLVGRVSASLQAMPSLLIEQAHQGRHLMEVVINNPLANSVNGDHYLPFARGANGRIIEQAKLLNPSGLSSLVNAAAVWQVASVIVAQKHLADISAKLDEIKQSLDDLKNLIFDKQDGDIDGTYRYLKSVARSFEKGVPKFSRVELETCRRELLQAESRLTRMFNRKLEQVINHKETMGTGDLLRDTLRRYEDLDHIRSSLMTCLRTQALAWHVLSLFPGEDEIADLWKEETLESMEILASMQDKILKTADSDVERIRAVFNRGSTLKIRRAEVRNRAQETVLGVVQTTSEFRSNMDKTMMMLEHNSDPIRLGLEVIDGEIQQVRVLD